MSEGIVHFMWNQDSTLSVFFYFPEASVTLGYLESPYIDLSSQQTEFAQTMRFKFCLSLRRTDEDSWTVTVECSPPYLRVRSGIPGSESCVRLAVKPALSVIGYSGHPDSTITSGEDGKPVLLDNHQRSLELIRGTIEPEYQNGDNLSLCLQLDFPYYESRDGTKHNIKHFSNGLIEKIKGAAQCPTNLDFTLNSNDGKSFKANRFLLVAHSPVFAAMLAHDTKENQEKSCTIADMDGEAVEALLKYLNTLDISEVAQSAEKLLYASEKYDLPELKSACADELAKQVSVSPANSIRLLILAEKFNLRQLKNTVLNNLKKCAVVLLETSELEGLRNDSPALHDLLLDTFNSAMKHPYPRQKKRKEPG